MERSILVFGGSGFVGTHLLRRLRKTVAAKIVSVDLRAPTAPISGVEYKIGDVRALGNFDVPDAIETIYNLAAVHRTPGHPDHEYYETNVGGAIEIAALARRKHVPQIVFTSSISVYGPGEDTKLEETPPAPSSSYGRSKLLAEQVFRDWATENQERKLVITRPAVVFGPGENGNFTRLATLLQKGFFIYPGRRDTIKGCFYVEDLINAIEFARSCPERFVLFNACYPDRYTIEDIVTAFRASYFPNARELLLPESAVKAAATILKPFSAVGVGIHPDRVMKLVKSTNVVPGWLQSKGQAPLGQLQSALLRWRNDSSGCFT
ncbi:NAD(P)-dependent oxidoreductase [Bradyrhizobium sp. CCBAU 53351]|uniref:NAD-dependent epimerase/dehydratase family protein n=1 Tax=Bradyrhizobium sp. CCBAU 53351 TaxID=1325114 RepID=UPI001889B0ED|nr:NAD(P)-dependent oxidoreductase [Bradyrhizobium sp. CCBAU 53351]QOZ75354.1 NAD(P)-dependent oxidoreductase [Bradyrhizobium sp. CCBAU 53351]